ncbi:MAG: ROK family protein [Planctomycetia bacterium]|nr:ROK family protein [Planctomycetia bacterium]
MVAEVKLVGGMPDFTQIKERLYVGMDVGGTKIRTSLVSESGTIYAHLKDKTPRDCPAEVTVEAIQESIRDLLDYFNLPLSRIAAIGIAIPGVVEPETGNVVVTPNMNLTGVPLGDILSQYFGIPVFLNNDGNLGTLGETWLGAARNARSVVGIFVGTGVGSGIVTNNQLWMGAGHAAGEIGHIIVSTPARSWKSRIASLLPEGTEVEKMADYPVCGCGNIGCLESFASRTAIEHAIQEAVALGVPSKITEFSNGDVSIVKSGALAKALKAEDPLVTAIVHYTAEVLAYACLTVRHLIDPEVIIFGGGVMEACYRYVLPIIEEIVSADKLPAAPSNRRIVLSLLGDDAVVLGAVALAHARVNRAENPVAHAVAEKTVKKTVQKTLEYSSDSGEIRVNGQSLHTDFYWNSCGKAILREEDDFKIRRRELKSFFDENVTQLIIASRHPEKIVVTPKAIDFLTLHGVAARLCTLEEGVMAISENAGNDGPETLAGIFILEK